VVFSDRGQLLRNPAAQALLEAEVLGGLSDLPSYERPKKLVLLEEEFSIEDGTLTPTQKVKRRVVQERFDAVIDALYEEKNANRAVFEASELSSEGSA
jgi:long-chain acyl-CoA synthetase